MLGNHRNHPQQGDNPLYHTSGGDKV